ncbi:MAG: hypothetical protein RIR83_212 [Pseudomonadota bacterium]
MVDMNHYLPIILIECVLVFGGVLLFAWWQLRDLKKEREKDLNKREKNQSH